MFRVISLFGVLVLGSAMAAGPNATQLLATNLARNCRDRGFANQIDLGHAEMDARRAHYTYDHDVRLRPGYAISDFDYIDSSLRVLRADFEVKRLRASAAEWITEEKSWTLQAEWAGGKTPSPKTLASLYVTLRAEHFRLSQQLVTDAKPFAEKLAEKARRVRQLQATSAISAEAAFEVATEAEEAAGLLQLAIAHVEEAKSLLEAAQAEWQAAVE